MAMTSKIAMGTYLAPGTFDLITPAQDEPITTHHKKKTQPRRDAGPPANIVSPSKPPTGDCSPIMNVPAELLVEIIIYGSQKDKLAWMLVSQKCVDPAERALWHVCGRKGLFKLLSMDEAKRERFVKMISHLDVGDSPLALGRGVQQYRSYHVQDGVYPDHIPMLPASWFIHPRLKSFIALSGNGGNCAIDDVFAALEQATTLEVLRINHYIERNTPDAFSRLLRSLPSLNVFEARYVGSEDLPPHLAMMPRIGSVRLDGTIDHEVVHQVLEMPGAFNKLQQLEIDLELDAAADLLQHLHHLKKLRIAFRENPDVSNQECTLATTSNLQTIGALWSLTLLDLSYVSFDLRQELKPLKQLSSLRNFNLIVESYNTDVFVPEDYMTDIIEVLRLLPLEEFHTNLSFRTAEELNSLGRACPRLQFLQFFRWQDPEGLDTSSSPVFPRLEHLQLGWVQLDDHLRMRHAITLD